jgi:tape measure domain-containing protein
MMKLAKGLGIAYAAKQTFDAAMAATTYLASAARDASQLSFALGQLTHNDGRKVMAEIGTLAANLGLDAKETAHQFEKMLKLQFSAEQSKTWIKLGADMQALGNSAEDVQGILMAIGQIRSKGRLQGEEMLQLAERGVSQQLVNEEIAKAMGVAPGAVQGLQQAGKVTSDIALEAIQKALLRKLKTNNPGEAAAAYVATSFAGKMAKSEGMMSQLRLGMGGAFETGVSKSGALEGFMKMLENPRVLSAIQGIAEGIGSIVGVVSELAVALGTGFLDAFGGSSKGAEQSGLKFEDFMNTLKELKPLIYGIGFALGLLTRGLGLMVQVGTAVISGIVEGITNGLGWLKETILGLGDSMIGWLKGALGIHSPSKEMAYLGEMSAEGYQRGLDSMTPTMGAAVPTMSSESAAYSAGRGAGRMAGSVAVGGITINVSSPDPQQAGKSVMVEFESRFAALMGTYAMGAGA